MSAALRQSYLRAMGLPLYVPRFILPGAAPSPAVEIDQPDVNSPAPQPSLEKTLPAQQPVAESGNAARQALGALTEPVATPASREKPETRRVESHAEALRFHASLIDTGIGLRMVADVSKGPLTPEARKLMAHIARAVAAHWQRAEQLAFSASNFEWPLVKVPGISQGAEEARDALSARLLSTEADAAIHLVLLFGDSLQNFISDDYLSAHNARLLRTVEVEQMLGNADHKAALWAELRAIHVGG